MSAEVFRKMLSEEVAMENPTGIQMVKVVVNKQTQMQMHNALEFSVGVKAMAKCLG